MIPKSNELPETKIIACPYCQGNFPVSIHCISITCRYCNRHVNVNEILYPREEKHTISIGKKGVICFQCGKEIFADKNAQAVTCIHCYCRNDLSDHKVRSLLGKIFQTHGSLYLKKKGVIETSTLHVGNAFIEGKINGDLNAMGTVKILKRGEVYGKITCRRLFVEKGGIFFGSVQMLN